MTAWDDLVAAAIRGTARQTPDPSGWRTELGDDIDGLPAEPPQLLLDAAALVTAARRAGRRPVRGVTPPQPAPDEHRVVVGGRVPDWVDALLTGSEPILLEHLLAGLRTRGLVLPVRQSVQLLDLARTRPWLQAEAAAAVGERGRWLAAQNPAWSWLPDLIAAQTIATDTVTDGVTGGLDDLVWREGQPQARLAWLHRALRVAPDQGLAVAAQALHPTRGEPAEVRAAIVGMLDASAEPLLEAALDDRAVTVRTAAAARLTKLGCGGYASRMTERARAWVTVGPSRLTVSLPTRLDESARRDGVGGKDPDKTTTAARGAWLDEVVAATPLAGWADQGGPGRLIGLSLEAPFGASLRHGWARRTVIEGDREWARWLLVDPPEPVDEVLAVADPADAERFVLRRLDAVTRKTLNGWLACLLHLPHPWPRAVVEGLAAALVRVPPVPSGQLHQLMARLANSESPSYADLFAHTAVLVPAQWEHPVRQAAEILATRRRLDEVLDAARPTPAGPPTEPPTPSTQESTQEET